MAHWLKTLNFLRRNAVLLLALAYVIVNVVAYLFPASYWYSLDGVKVQDGIAGQPISMAIDRTIRRPFIGHWSVTVHRVNGGTSEIVCVSAGTGSYKTTSQVPENLTLGWWTGGDCKTLQPGFYNLTTLTHIDVINILQPKSVINQSNLFEVK